MENFFEWSFIVFPRKTLHEITIKIHPYLRIVDCVIHWLAWYWKWLLVHKSTMFIHLKGLNFFYSGSDFVIIIDCWTTTSKGFLSIYLFFFISSVHSLVQKAGYLQFFWFSFQETLSHEQIVFWSWIFV